MKSAIKREQHVKLEPGVAKQEAGVKHEPSVVKEEYEPRLEDKIRHQLYDSGERDRLKSLLAERLDSCGWREDIKRRTREYVTKRGRNNVTIEDIVRAVRPEGRATVPDVVKAELLSEIKRFIHNL